MEDALALLDGAPGAVVPEERPAPVAPVVPVVPGDQGDPDGVEDALALLDGTVEPMAGRRRTVAAGSPAAVLDDDGVEDALALLDGARVPRCADPGTRRAGGAGEESGDGFEDALAVLRPAAGPHAPEGGGGPEGTAGTGPRPGSGPRHEAQRGGPRHGAQRGGPRPGVQRDGAQHGAQHGAQDGAVGWDEAREIAARAGRRGGPALPERVPLVRALGRVLAAPLTALCDLPSFDTAAMDGWAVAGPGPWTVRDVSVLAGRGGVPPLADGTAVRIATGARIPPEATAVLRSEHARLDTARGLLGADRPLSHGQDIRPRGQECRTGDRLLDPARVVDPAVLGLAAAAGYDALAVAARPRAEVLILGDELLSGGLPHDGLIRDALGPLLPPWLEALGAETVAVRRIGDDADALLRAVTDTDADLLLTTGGTAAGPVDHVRSVLRATGAELLVDSVAVRPGHPMLLARLAAPAPGGDGAPVRHLVGLPGNPLAAVAGLLTLAEPLVRGLLGRVPPVPRPLPAGEEIPGHPRDTRLVPCLLGEGRLLPLRYGGSAMLRGIASAEGLAVVPPGGARPGDPLELLALPGAPLRALP
ncbi:molybdopterin molybdotransferase MoeA [Streptomyces sp. NPDC000594]|uniref:molybdopterin molybdotransferase MoeA n=1 Tax=Streptomyces sp. NPDC000594 TaxID=3154261 RepID=UPI003325C1C1